MSGRKRKNVEFKLEIDSESENDDYQSIRKGDSRKTNKCMKRELEIKTEFDSNISQEKAKCKSHKRKSSEIQKKVNIKEEPELDNSDFEASSKVNVKKIKKEKLEYNLRKKPLSAKIKEETYSDTSDSEDGLNIKTETYSIKKEIYSDTSGPENSVTIKNAKINIKKEKDIKNKLKSKIKNELNIEKQNHLNKDKNVNKYKETKVKENIISKINVTTVNKVYWEDHQLLTEYQNLDLNTSKNIIRLFSEGCTIPFIARYRKDMTNNMTPEELRDTKSNYDKIIALKSRIQTVLNCIEKSGNLDFNMKKTILNAKSIEEVEHIYAPFKPGSKKTLAERARALGLQKPAEEILENNGSIDIYTYVDKANSELDTYDKVEKGIIHIIAHIISVDIKVLTFLRRLKTQGNFRIEVKKLAKRGTKTKDDASQQPDESKYENYFDFKIPAQYIKPHQVLAINRGESQKILSVKVIVPEFILKKFTCFCKEKFMFNNCDNTRQRILNEAIKDAYTRLMQPLLIREIRSELKLNAEKASYDVFCSNLKQLLLMSPIKGRSILGIDPGFSNGCKAALISPTGSLLTSNVFSLHTNKAGKEAKVLRDMLLQYNCSLIALGNGTACRETETWLSDLISKNYFLPLDVSYIIVNENGASIYSCSPEAQKEFPTLDPNIISAVSLARRVQEPLAEFVKVEPRHLGVGMYQHDLPKTKLNEALDEVVSECVSFVGVDLNTASQCLLRRIAGLSDKKATKIIEYRDRKGPFINRKELLKISGIGSKIFEQCVGFLRVGPTTVDEESDFYENPNSNKLDCTIIHPESYELTAKLLKQFNSKLSDIGTNTFISSIKEKVNTVNLEVLSESFGTSEETLKLVFDALGKPLNYDLRNDCSKVPLFKKGVTNVSDLHVGTILTGRVNNVTHFGSFVDIGIGINGLIHTSRMNGQNLQAGNTVEVRVINIEIQRKRIGLELLQVT